MGKAQTRATNKYISKVYDRFNLTVPKGEKEIIQNHAAAHGYKSVNSFIYEAITEKMAREKEEDK